ncbi:MAG: fatty acid desaturase [Gammaproteobacteria bacterium]|nr:fatty acid desaturase [Gammaproteobacteria bacterium]
MFSDLPVWGYILIALGLTHITIASVTIYLHRHQAHRAIELHPAIAHFFRFWLWLTTGMVTKEWVAVHRKHHARVEQPEDPHSPQIRGIRKVLFEGAELYKAEAQVRDTLDQYGHQTPCDWVERRIYKGRQNWGIAVMFAIDVTLFGAAGIAIWAVQMAWIPFFAAGVINGIGHYWGYRNFESPDASTNIVPFGLLVGGEELHNNHHAFASSARFSSKWYELDLGWGYIRVLDRLGLAGIKKLPPMPLIDLDKHGVDLDTLRAVIASRLHVTAHYARNVIAAVYKDEKAKANNAARRLLRRGRRLMVRNESLLDLRTRKYLESILAQHQPLRVVYEFQRRLHDLWQQRTASQERLLHALQEWCREAEATGIEALEAFARELRGYTLVTN